MFKKLFLPVVIFLISIPSLSNATSELDTRLNDVKIFYTEFERLFNDRQTEELVALIEKHVAEDFQHLDDGKYSYGKKEMIDIANTLEDESQDMKLDIEFIKLNHGDQANEVNLEFIITQTASFDEPTQSNVMQLKCFDTLQYTSPQDFKLHTCDCLTDFEQPKNNTAE